MCVWGSLRYLKPSGPKHHKSDALLPTLRCWEESRGCLYIFTKSKQETSSNNEDSMERDIEAQDWGGTGEIKDYTSSFWHHDTTVSN